MHTTHLRKVGGSVMLTVPPAILELLHLHAGDTVDLGIEDGRLVVELKSRPHYTLAELLAESDYSQPRSVEEQEWINAPAVGRELI